MTDEKHTLKKDALFRFFSNDFDSYTELIEDLEKQPVSTKELADFILMVHLSPMATLIINEELRIQYVNKESIRQTKTEYETVIGRTLMELSFMNLHGSDIRDLWKQAVTNGKWSGTVNYLDKDGCKKSYLLQLICLSDQETQEKYCGLFLLDALHLGEINNVERQFAYFDRVTHLPNFNQIAYDINKHILSNEQQPSGLALFRCSNIAKISALYSREVRKLVTLEMVRRIQNLLPENYRLYRLSREIFAVYVKPLTDEESFKACIEKIRNYILQPLNIDKHVILMNIEIGATSFPSKTRELSDLLEHAGICLDQHETSKIVYFSEEMTKDFTTSLHTVERLKPSIEQDLLEMYYQPIFDHNDNIVAAEALLRWNDPELGYVPPNRIIRYAEEHDYVSELANWIIDRVFKDKLYKDYSINVTINVDVTQVEQPDFLESVQRLIKEHQVDTGKIIFEITEHQAFEKSPLAVEILHKLKDLGFKLALDDFGVGHSALALLGDLPADILKIDASFITNVEENSRKGIIARHIVNLAQNLGLRTCCEGIETVKEAKLARLIHSNYMQGYLFSKALPLNEFHEFSKHWKENHV